VPFAPTRAERLANGDPRPSIEERYPTKDAYVFALRAATRTSVRQGYLLEEDAYLLMREAEEKGVPSAP
jgi:Alpha/beta hydrolase domain